MCSSPSCATRPWSVLIAAFLRFIDQSVSLHVSLYSASYKMWIGLKRRLTIELRKKELEVNKKKEKIKQKKYKREGKITTIETNENDV